MLKRDKSNFQIIEAIIDFRKGIYQDIWANKALSMRIFNGVEKIKDLHLTRTTRVIQEFLKSGEDKSIREAAEIENQIKRNKYGFWFPPPLPFPPQAGDTYIQKEKKACASSPSDSLVVYISMF